MVRKTMLIAVALLAGCSQNLYVQGKKFVERGEYDRAIETFYQEISKNPQSVDAWRELGVAYYESGDLNKAEDALKRANSMRPDVRSNLYLGLIYENQELYDEAINAYRTSLGLDPSGKARNLIRAHLDRLILRSIEKEVARALADEAAIDVDTIPTNTVAVTDFDGSYLSPAMMPIARGLAEFTSNDLAKVRALRVVERLKIDVILDELKLGATDYVDQSTAPRLGRLLGSHRLVTGTVLGFGESGIRLDGVIVNTSDSSSSVTEPAEGELQRIFKVQKDFVFKVVEDMGISLTPDERDAISEVPTESYLAFLAYCRGLDYQRRGFPRNAQAAFHEAVQEDQSFREADIQHQKVTADLASGGRELSLSTFESSVTGATEPSQLTTGFDARLSAISRNTGTMQDVSSQRPADSPPVVRGRTETVVITGDLDAD